MKELISILRTKYEAEVAQLQGTGHGPLSMIATIHHIRLIVSHWAHVVCFDSCILSSELVAETRR